MNFNRCVRGFIAFFLILISRCAGPKMEMLSIDASGYQLTVEIADSPETRAVGLMNRRQLADTRGMLFVFDKEEPVSFWMKDTRIPLSIAFISAHGIIRQIEDMKPYSLESIVSRRSVLYALEVNQGWFDERGIGPGDHVTIPERIRRPIDQL